MHGIFLASDWIHQTFLDKGGWATWVGWIISIVLWLCVAVITYFLITPLTACIASPFNEILSERVESLCLGETNKSKEPFSIKSFLRGMAITTGASVKLMIITLGLQLIALCIFLVPVIGPWIASIASAMITIRYITLEFTSYAMDRRFYTYAQRRDFLKRNRARTIGLGTMAFIIMLIPFVNAIMIPASAISGTLIFCDDLKNTTETKP